MVVRRRLLLPKRYSNPTMSPSQNPPRFENLLPNPRDAAKAAFRGKLVYVLNSQGEILPSANSPRGKLWNIVNSSDSSIDDCEEIILLDSALTSRIFRVANSAAMGLNVENVSQAILRLGFSQVREQAFNATIFDQYSSWSLPPEWDLFWLRNIFVARCCEKIAAAYSLTDGSEYLTGLIHDMGWLFLATYFPTEFTGLFSCGLPISAAEKQLLPFGHHQIASAIAARSLLPLRAVNAILYHHDPVKADRLVDPSVSPRFLATVVKICDGLADAYHMDMFGAAEFTVEELQEGPDVRWLNNYGEILDVREIAEEELMKSKDLFEVFFSDSKVCS